MKSSCWKHWSVTTAIIIIKNKNKNGEMRERKKHRSDQSNKETVPGGG